MSTSFELLAFVAGQYALLLAVIAAAWSVGRSLTARLVYRDELEALPLSTALGLGVWSTALMLLALVGLLRPLPVLLLLAASQVVSRDAWAGAWRATRHWLDASTSVACILGATLVALLIVPLLTLPLYPPTEFDATMFHLPLATTIAEQGRIDFFADLRYPVFPALQETIYATALLFGSDVAPATIHFGAFLLVALLVYAWGAWVASRRAGLWAALLWLGANAAARNAMGAYVDCALALFVTAALFALHRYLRGGEAGWIGAAALLAGFGAATKYHGLYFVAAVAAAVAVHALRHRRWRHLALFATLLAVALAPWYGFLYYHTASPLFPFFPAVFGLTPWAYELRYTASVPMSQVDGGPWALATEIATLATVLVNKLALLLRQGLRSTLMLPLDVLRSSGPFKGHPLSQLTHLGLPLVVLLMLRVRHARYLALLAGLYLLAWAGTAQELRYLIVALPMLALLVAEGADRLLAWLAPERRRRLAWALTAAVTLTLALQVYGLSTEISWDQGRPPATAAQRERFLELRLHPYAAIRALNQRHGADYTVYALFGENMKHFVAGEHLGDWFGPRRYATVLGQLHNRDVLHRTLAATGADYLLLPNLAVWKRRLHDQYPMPRPESLAPLFELAYEDRFSRVYRIAPVPASSVEQASGPTEQELSGFEALSGAEASESG